MVIFFVPLILFSLLQLKNVIYKNNLIFTVPKLITHLSFFDYNLPSQESETIQSEGKRNERSYRIIGIIRLLRQTCNGSVISHYLGKYIKSGR